VNVILLLLYVVALFLGCVVVAWLTERWRKSDGLEDEK
jgi:hypothetical protein